MLRGALTLALLLTPRSARAEDRATAEAASPSMAIVLATLVSGDVAIDVSTLDAQLADAASDLGLEIEMTRESVDRSEVSLPAEAQRLNRVLVVPTVVARSDSAVEIRIVVAHPGSKVLLSRNERTELDDLEVRALVMLRDLVSQARAPATEMPAPTALSKPASRGGVGRAILAVNGTLYGGFLGYSLQRASGSDDPRLLYPLIAVGSGVGLGSAIILADEFDITGSQAWYISAGSWWPAVAGHLLYQGRFANRADSGDEGWAFGLISSVTGVGLATVGLTGSPNMGPGGAVFAHSGGALGTIVGGLTEFAVAGDAEQVPLSGMGYGAGTGWLLGNSMAILFDVDASNLLAVDLGILLGGLAGAAATSPLLFDDVTKAKTRGWVAATGGGLVAGGIVAWWLAWDDLDGEGQAVARYLPTVGQVGIPVGLGERGGPGWGLTWSGQLR
jgi:hypothetical protein